MSSLPTTDTVTPFPAPTSSVPSTSPSISSASSASSSIGPVGLFAQGGILPGPNLRLRLNEDLTLHINKGNEPFKFKLRGRDHDYFDVMVSLEELQKGFKCPGASASAIFDFIRFFEYNKEPKAYFHFGDGSKGALYIEIDETVSHVMVNFCVKYMAEPMNTEKRCALKFNKITKKSIMKAVSEISVKLDRLLQATSSSAQ